MNYESQNLSWAIIGVVGLVIVNLVCLFLVVASDVIFGAPPQFTIPMFVPVLVAISAALVFLFRAIRRRRTSTLDSDVSLGSSATTSVRARRRGKVVLQSALVIRRNETSVNSASRRSYVATV